MSTKRKTIVVVEDEPSVLSVIERLLKKVGYDVLPFAHPHLAREYFRNAVRPPALLITDIMLPGMSGFELCDAAREEHVTLPVLFISGYPLESLPASHATLPEVSCLVTKPFGLNVLRDAVEDLMAGRTVRGAEAFDPDIPLVETDSVARQIRVG